MAGCGEWEELSASLAEVFNLILFHVHKIVDDTSLEKLLEMLESTLCKDSREKKICLGSCLKFLSEINVETCDASTVSFALRLCGTTSLLKETKNTRDYLSCEVLNEDELWSDAVVRDSFFKTVPRMLTSHEDLRWLQKSGVLQAALDCFTDSSVFVAETSRKCFAKYLVSLHNEKSKERQDCCLTKIKNSFSTNMCVQCIIHHLKFRIEQLPTGLAGRMSSQVSVVQFLLSLMEEDGDTAQDILKPSAMMLSCFELLHYANKDDCGNVMDSILTLLTKTSQWKIKWTMLLHVKDAQNLFCTLLEYALVVYKRGFYFHSLQLIQGLAVVGDLLNFDESCQCLLLMLAIFPVHEMLTASIHTSESDPDLSASDIAKQLLLTDCSTDTGLENIFVTLNKTLKHSHAYAAQSLAVTTDIIQKIKLTPRLCHVVRTWCKDILRHLDSQFHEYLKRNSLIKLFIKAMVVCIERGVLDHGEFDAKKKSYELLVKVLKSSQDSKILSNCFKGLKCFFSTNLPSHVKLEELTQLLCEHCSTQYWDIRDSTLDFLSYVLSTFNVANLLLLLENDLMLSLWKLIKDPESYVRASAISLLGCLSRNDVIWQHYCKAISLSKEEVVNYLLDAFHEEEAAFPRRAVIDLLTLWLKRGESEISANSSVTAVITKACQDFDWEVKLRALQFCETLLHLQNGSFVESFSSLLSTAILGALTDCDNPVRERGVVLFKMLKTFSKISDVEVIHYEGLLDDLEAFVLHTAAQRKCSILEMLVAIHIPAVHLEEPNLRTLLKDILTAASDNEDNLLDCY